MDTENLPTEPTDASAQLDLASRVAAVNLLFVEQELGRRAVDPTTTTRQLLDIGEHSYKVSGMVKRQEPANTGSGFSITINIPGGDSVKLGASSNAEVVDPTDCLLEEGYWVAQDSNYVACSPKEAP